MHKDNNESIYGAFCEDLEQLAEYLGKEPEETEKLIFSKGGKNSELGEESMNQAKGTANRSLHKIQELNAQIGVFRLLRRC